MLTYLFFRFLVFVFSLLPMWAVYVVANFTYFVVYAVAGYRRKVVFQNLQNSFPEKTERELHALEKAFYHNLSDIIVEGLKGLTMKKEHLIARYKIRNPEFLQSHFSSGQDVIAVGAHYANWEWGIAAAAPQFNHLIISFYTELTNKRVDVYLNKRRMRFGVRMLSTKETSNPFSTEKDRPAIYFFGADQSPSNLKGVEWLTFLNQETACMKGPEFFARRNNCSVVYFDVQRTKRGYYEVEVTLLQENSKATDSGQITRAYMDKLEKIIRKNPENYLWSHRRWKHKREKQSQIKQ